MVFAAIAGASYGSFEPCGPQPWPAEARKRAPNLKSMTNDKESDSSSIFRSPQNDNAAFALNHFGSETHSSVRPGRLRGSHL